MFDNTVTFRVSDATIDLPPIELGYSGDIYFEFRTTKESGTFLHVEGPEDFLKVSINGETRRGDVRRGFGLVLVKSVLHRVPRFFSCRVE